MGSSELSTKESSKVESTSLTKIFEQCCPIYMSYGMSYDEFWYNSPYRAMFYREAHDITTKQKDEEFWIQGMYIYEALCDVSPILHAFSKSGTKPLPYRDKPYMYATEHTKSKEEIEREKENERLVAQLHFDRWMRDTAKQFENKSK